MDSVSVVRREGLIKVRTDAQRRYQSTELNPKVAPYRAQAYKAVNDHGEKSCVRMGGEAEADFDVFNPKAGAVRNFRWRMRGEAQGDTTTRRGALIYASSRIRTRATNPWSAPTRF